MRLSRLSAWTVVVPWLFASCVDLTPPWEKGEGAGGRGEPPAAGGAGGLVSDGPAGPSDADEQGGGGAIGSGGSGAGDAIGGAGGTVDAPTTGAGGGAGASPDGGAEPGVGGSMVDGPVVGAGGGAGSLDGDDDLAGVGTGGEPGTGGTLETGGATGTGGVTGTGGSSTTGGASGSGGKVSLDAGPDLGPDHTPDLGSDLGVDAGSAAPPTAGLVIYYPCDRADSTDATKLPDGSGNNRPGTLSIGLPPDGGTAGTGPGYEFVAGQVGSAVRLHREGYGYVKMPTEVFQTATDITIAYWVNIATSQNWQRMVDIGMKATPYQFVNSSTGTKYLNMVPKNAESNMLFSITTDGYSNEQTLSAPSLSTNTWTHLAVVLASGAGGKLYVNGVEQTPNSAMTLRPATIGAAIDYAFIGKSQFDADPAFDGAIDEFRVYSRALSAAEVLVLYQFSGS